MKKTTIEWCGFAANPIRAQRLSDGKRGHFCTKAGPGCRRCYSESWNRRFGTGLPYAADCEALVEPFVDERELRAIVRSKAPAGSRVFVCDMTDLFHRRIGDDARDQIFAAMSLRPDLVFCVLTKRPAAMREYFTDGIARGYLVAEQRHALGEVAYRPSEYWTASLGRPVVDCLFCWPPPNVWLGVSVENQAAAAARIPILLATPAALRFVSVEPMLGPVDLVSLDDGGYEPLCALLRYPVAHAGLEPIEIGLDWVIAGGETGPGARPVHPDWIRSLRDQCVTGGVPFCFKAWGEWAPHNVTDSAPWAWGHGRYADWRGDDYPEHARGWHVSRFRGGLTCCARLGRKHTGRLLDGQTWDQAPAGAET